MNKIYKKIIIAISVAITHFSLFSVSLADDATTTPIVTPSLPDSVNLIIRAGDTVVFNGRENIADLTASDTPITATSLGAPVMVGARTLLSTLTTLDSSDGDFDISDLQYFSSFNSFYINCIIIKISTTTPLCGEWQFEVNGSSPQQGIDHVSLNNNDSVVLYFGNPHNVSVSNNSVVSGNPFSVSAKKYNPNDNSYSPLTGVTLGVTQNNANDPFNPNIIATIPSDQNGEAIFTLNATGTYAVGIAEDFYFPSVSVNVIEATTSATSTPADNTGAVSGGGGVSHLTPNLANAIRFLVSNQEVDGSFGNDLFTDWAAIALSTTNETSAKDKLKNYFLNHTPTFSNVTDYERHAMALMSLGINPYNGTSIDYIKEIGHAFDGKQIGDPNLINDDIFAVFPLFNAGYGKNDSFMQIFTKNIIDAQRPDGSYEGSVDLTASAIQALVLNNDQPDALASINKAKNYLKNNQSNNGGWGSSYSTSWVANAIASLGEDAQTWINSSNTPLDYLYNQQQADGGFESLSTATSSRVWATSYAITATLGKAWNSVLATFPKVGHSSSEAANASGASFPINTASSTRQVSSTTTNATTTNELLNIPTKISTTTDSQSQNKKVSTTTKNTTNKNLIQKKPVTSSTTSANTSTLGQNVADVSSAPSLKDGLVKRVWGGLVSIFHRIF